MTIRKKWILIIGTVSIIAIITNAFVLSTLITKYFNTYLDENYTQNCEQIINYLKKDLEAGNTSEEQIEEGLEAYLNDSITQISVYDAGGNLLAQVTSTYMNHTTGMGMMREMMNNRNTALGDTAIYEITLEDETYGEVHITRYATSAESYAAQMFRSALFQNSMISIVVVILLVLILGALMSRRISQDLIDTAEIAKGIDLGTGIHIRYSKTKEIQSIQQSLASLESRLKLKQKARKKLVDEMVHQTRTPLTILKMHIEGMEDGVIEMTPEEIKVCENQIENLTDIITNISSLIDANNPEGQITPEEFELHQFLKQISNGMRTQFQKKQIDFELRTTEKIKIQSDKYRLGQTIYNILTNAYKFTPAKGSVTMAYTQENGWIKLEIEDTGCGISQEEQKKIFQAYYKKEEGIENQGDGLGLYVAKENIELMQGNIEVDSIEGKGSKFRIYFPIVYEKNKNV